MTVDRFQTDYYFEAHITIEPLDEETEEKVQELVKSCGFRIASLYKKRSYNKSDIDSFMTSRNKSFDKILADMCLALSYLRQHKIKVYRYKIENTLIDIKYV